MGHVKDLRKRTTGYTGDQPYWARYRDAGGKEHGRTFRTKREAEQWLAEQSVAKARGEWVDPMAGKITFRAFAETWRQMQVHRPGTVAQVESHLRNHVYPAIGDRSLASIRPSHIQVLVKGMSGTLAPSTVETVYRHVSSVFKAATRDRLIPRTPCEDIRLPKIEHDEKVIPLELAQVEAVADEMTERWQASVWVGAGTGLRQGEVFGLTVDRIDFLRRAITVDRQMVTVSNRAPAFGPPKTKASFRTVPLPDSVAFVLAEHLRQFPAGDDSLVFTIPDGGPVRRQRIGEAWRRAAKAAGIADGIGFHATRHFYASLLIQSGASVKVVQKRLGHASAIETLDTYGHLWPDTEDETRSAVDKAFATLTGQRRDVLAGEG